jgi:hypothetical protein
MIDPTDKVIHPSIPADVHAALLYRSRQTKTSSSEIVTDLLRRGLRNELKALQRALTKTLKRK